MMLKHKKEDWELNIIWRLFIQYIVLYIFAFIGLYYIATGQVKFATLVCAYAHFLLGAFGVGPVSHNFYSHKSYKASNFLQKLMVICQSVGGLESVYDWVRIHRGHHKYHDTPNDPLYLGRGVFYVYFVRWFVKEPPEMTKALDSIYKKDLEDDENVMFQHKYYKYHVMLWCGITPCLYPILLWNESVKIAFFVNIFRWFCNWTQYCISNTFAHIFGDRPHDKNFSAANHWLSHIILLGEGYHNFHHVFPFDYSCSEPDSFMEFFNWGKYTIDAFTFLGFCSNRKVASPQLVAKRSMRTGDGSKYYDPHFPEPELWENNNYDGINDLDDREKKKNEDFLDKTDDISEVPEISQPKSCEYEFYSYDVVRKCT